MSGSRPRRCACSTAASAAGSPTPTGCPRWIAAELYVSANTVKSHQRAVYRKLGASGRRDAIRRARALGLL